ncbi:MAG: hypothetical protein WCO00_05240 [Rhodospirillaceae bacterium]
MIATGDDTTGAIAAALANQKFGQAVSIAYGVLHTAIEAFIAGEFGAVHRACLGLRAAAPGFHHATHLLAAAAAALGQGEDAEAAQAEGLAAAPQLAPFYQRLASRRATIRRFIPTMKCEVVADCQYDCPLCAHGELRQRDIGYQLSLEQLQAFLTATLDSGYLIGQLAIHGSGEPLLWQQLGPGLGEIKRSGAVCWTWITSNGLLLHRLGAEELAQIDCMDISLYQGNKKTPTIREIVAGHPEKLFIVPMDDFVDNPGRSAAPVPCPCLCAGPMLAGDKVYLYCGPPVFGAGKRLKRNPETDLALWSRVGPN